MQPVVIIAADLPDACAETLRGVEGLRLAAGLEDAARMVAQSQRVDLVILEIAGDGVAAMRFCRELRERSAAKKASVLGIAAERDLACYLRSGAFQDFILDWLRKPVLVEELLYRVQMALQNDAVDERLQERSLRHALQIATEIGHVAGNDAAANVAKIIEHWLETDGIWIISKRPEQRQEVQVWHRCGTLAGAELQWGDLFDAIKEGLPVIYSGETSELLGGVDQRMRSENFAIVPMHDDRLNIVGALVVATKRRLAEEIGVLEALQIAALRLGLELDIQRAIELSQAKGLHDALTHLPNRLLFNDRLATTIREASRTGEMFAVLFVDLDKFKQINDGLGHAVGDQVLLAVANRLLAGVRSSDTVARYAGDEFTLVLRHVAQRDDVLRIAEKICRLLEDPLTIENHGALHVTCSIGISFYPDDATTSDLLLQKADVAMYGAKRLGRNTFQTFVAVPDDSDRQRLALEAKLRSAGRNEEFRLYYQPILSADAEDIIGVEALLRWEHPELGMISPGFFIPLAEEIGLIGTIGAWVLKQACADLKRWQDQFQLPLRVSVNLSSHQLKLGSLLNNVQGALANAGLDARHLDLEISETANTKTIPNLPETLQGLKKLGCTLSIDDFGTGQSSLDNLRRLPVDRVKLDPLFVRNIGVDADDEAIVGAAVAMAHRFGQKVIAAGVECEQQLRFLRSVGCEELQGYLFSRPLPAQGIETLLKERRRLLSGAVA